MRLKKLMEIYNKFVDRYQRVLRIKDRSEWSFKKVPDPEVAKSAREFLQNLLADMGVQGWEWYQVESGLDPWSGHVCHYQVRSRDLSQQERMELIKHWNGWYEFLGEIRRQTWWLNLTTHRNTPGDRPLVIEIRLQEPDYLCGRVGPAYSG